MAVVQRVLKPSRYSPAITNNVNVGYPFVVSVPFVAQGQTGNNSHSRVTIKAEDIWREVRKRARYFVGEDTSDTTTTIEDNSEKNESGKGKKKTTSASTTTTTNKSNNTTSNMKFNLQLWDSYGTKVISTERRQHVSLITPSLLTIILYLSICLPCIK